MIATPTTCLPRIATARFRRELHGAWCRATPAARALKRCRRHTFNAPVEGRNAQSTETDEIVGQPGFRHPNRNIGGCQLCTRSIR